MKKFLLVLLSFFAMTTVEAKSPALNFTAAGEPATIKIKEHGTPNPTTIWYSYDNVNYFRYYFDTEISLNSGETVYFLHPGTDGLFSSGYSNYYYFEMTGTIQCLGNIMSLIDSTMTQTYVPEFAFYNLFQDCESLTYMNELPATTMNAHCYQRMFAGCTSLWSIGPIEATNLAEECFREMYSGCEHLLEAPALNATVMKENCYANMFENCTKIKEAPELSSTSLAPECYIGMFSGCTSLVKLPKLPATTLADECYAYMFYGCNNLQISTTKPGKSWSIPAQATAADDWNYSMFEDTGGSFTGDPQIGVTYYVASDTTTETAIEVVAENIELAIAPNPVRLGEVAQITVEDGSMVEVYNMNGQCVWQKCDAAGSVNVSGLNEAGVYMVKVTKGNGLVETGKLIVE